MNRQLTVTDAAPDEGRPDVTVATCWSAALGRRTDLAVYSPNTTHRDVPVVVLLHGVRSSFWSWLLAGRASDISGRLIEAGEIPPAVIVMPSDGHVGTGSAYLNTLDGPRVADYIVDEIPAIVRQLASSVGTNSPWFITGSSMGGFGAMQLGAANPNHFAAFAALSPIVDMAGLELFLDNEIDIEVLQTATPVDRLLVGSNQRLRFRFDCGADDPLIESCRRLHATLSDAGIDHHFDERAGGHNWDYWRRALPAALTFLMEEQP